MGLPTPTDPCELAWHDYRHDSPSLAPKDIFAAGFRAGGKHAVENTSTRDTSASWAPPVSDTLTRPAAVESLELPRRLAAAMGWRTDGDEHSFSTPHTTYYIETGKCISDFKPHRWHDHAQLAIDLCFERDLGPKYLLELRKVMGYAGYQPFDGHDAWPHSATPSQKSLAALRALECNTEPEIVPGGPEAPRSPGSPPADANRVTLWPAVPSRLTATTGRPPKDYCVHLWFPGCGVPITTRLTYDEAVELLRAAEADPDMHLQGGFTDWYCGISKKFRAVVLRTIRARALPVKPKGE